MSSVKGNNNLTNNTPTESIKKKVHFEHNDTDDLNDNEDKFLGSQGEMPQLRLRNVGDGKRNSIIGMNYNNERVFNGKLFNISPAHVLFFPTGVLENDGNVTLTLTNEHSNVVAFKVKTTSPSKYRVRPGNGVLPPKSKAEVVITLIAGQSVNIHSQDKFLVLGMEIKDESLNAIELSELWRTCPKDKLMEHKLYCDQQSHTNENEPSSPIPSDSIILENLRLQSFQLLGEVTSLKKTLNLMLFLQIITITVIILMYWCQLWPPYSSSEDSSKHNL